MSTQAIIRIATRSSTLALWQANEVKLAIEALGHNCTLVPMESSGDLLLTKPIYAMGISGVFTKQLDAALLEKAADLAVHSLKDVPTQLAKSLLMPGVLPRGSHEDVLVAKDKTIFTDKSRKARIYTSSLRRQAQWLNRYPSHEIAPVRGNIQTRLRKFWDSTDTDGIIFAKAGLERLGLLDSNTFELDWMVPAPAQGIIGIVCREDDHKMVDLCETINHQASFIAGAAERQFLNRLMGGCSVPVSAFARIENDQLIMHGAIHSLDGKLEFLSDLKIPLYNWREAGNRLAELLLSIDGAPALVDDIRERRIP